MTRITYTNAFLFPLTAAVRFAAEASRRQKGRGERGDLYVPPAPLNSLLAGVLAVESAVVGAGIDMPVGSSLLCLARKR